jgi:hypothetical protein
MRDRIWVDFITNRITMVNHKLIREIHNMHDIWLILLE